MLFRPHNSRIMLKRLTWVNSICFLCLIFNWIFSNLIIQHWADWKLSFIIYFYLLLWGYLGLMVNVTGFGILMTFKSGCLFFLKGHHGLITRVMGPSTLDFFFIGLFSSHYPSYRSDKLTHMTQFVFLNWLCPQIYHLILC